MFQKKYLEKKLRIKKDLNSYMRNESKGTTKINMVSNRIYTSTLLSYLVVSLYLIYLIKLFTITLHSI